MVRANFLLLPLFLSLVYVETATVTSSTSFIKASCSTTRYPALCVQSLSIYAPTIQKSPYQLAQTALSVSLTKAQEARTFVKELTQFKGLKAREYGAIKDCWEEISEGVDRLSKSVQELKYVGKTRGADFLWHLSNVDTWVSAAITVDNTCMDGFAGQDMDGRIKTSIRARVTHVAQVTSNALGLVNQFAAKY